MGNTIQLNQGKKSLIAFVFSCPGSFEQKNKQLVSGQTGNNLTELIRIMREEKNCLKYFDSNNRYNYRITNSSEIIRYKKKDGITEPKDIEIKRKDNLNRLLEDLKGYEVVIAFGKKANIAVNAIKDRIPKTQIISVRHLSYPSINHIHKDCNGQDIIKSKNPKIRKDNTYRRLNVIATEIAEQIIEK